eukprot:scaffold1352_cov180-Amphora_coffeaeformis.AAC.6
MHDFRGEVTPPYTGWDGHAGRLKPDCKALDDGSRQNFDDAGDDSSAGGNHQIDDRLNYGGEGCGNRCLDFGRNPCWPTSHYGSRSRRLQSSLQDLPGSTSLNHRRVTDEDFLCSIDDLQMSYNELTKHETLFLATEAMLQNCLDQTSSSGRQHIIFACVLTGSIPILPHIPLLNKVIKCQLDGAPGDSEGINRPKYQNLLVQARRLEAFIDLILLPYSGSLPDDLSDIEPPNKAQMENFNEAFLKGVADNSEDGRSISDKELDEILKIAFTTAIADDFEQFVVTWNMSLYFWKLGVHRANELPSDFAHDFFDLAYTSLLIQNFERSRKDARNEGYSGFTDAWTRGLEEQMLEDASMRIEICANVHLRANQEIALAGSAFEVSLEISNSGFIPMQNIFVDLQLSPLGNSTHHSTKLFIVEETKLYNISEVDGSRTLVGNTAAKAIWVLNPLPEAAPGFVARYDVSGTLMYSIDGVDYLQVLSPDTITIVPGPELHMTFFRPREAYSDDPFTFTVEPSIPFQLGLLIENRGYGEARDLKIVGSPTDILKDEKGRPTDFTILQSRVGTNPALSILGIKFGNIQGRGNVATVWDIVSDTRGILQNYSAVFEFGGLINDDSQSLIRSTATYELSHIVRVTGEHPAATNGTRLVDDGIGDFLANVYPDPYHLPDTVFSSDAQQGTFSVDHVVDEATWERPVRNSDNDTYNVRIKHTVESLDVSSDWVYVRFDDPLGGGDYILQSVKRSDLNYELIPEFNSWQTSFAERLEDGRYAFHNHIHLFDLGVAAQYILSYTKQEPASNLRITGANEHSLTIAWDGAEGATSYYVVFKPAILSDQYYKPATTFTQDTSLTISNLGAGTSLEVRVYSGKDGKYEKSGASIVVQTFGISHCGNGGLDAGEECDDGILNGSPDSNCTDVCVSRVRLRVDGTSFFISHAPTVSPAPTISPNPSSPPTRRPTESPTVSVSPTSSPSTESSPPSASPSVSQQPSVSVSPSEAPSASFAPTDTQAPSISPTAVLTTAPSESPTTLSPTAPLEPICPASDSCKNEQYNFFWISKTNRLGQCRSRCVNAQKASRLINNRDFSCGLKCGGNPTTLQPPTQPTVTVPTPPAVVPTSSPTGNGECGQQDSCIVDMSGTPGYWMSFVLFGRTCARRCMRLENVVTAKDRGYVCGTECEGIPLATEQVRDAPGPVKIQPQKAPSTKDEIQLDGRPDVFRRSRPRGPK